ncbi:zinc carboxypeptidase family protein (macronuclear) [Tetrahymena thermophila SB210]|uniref:Zinc carboxypeptidase family protein n=1 Tax=Tetrahymena thermophila (strain SB210) TaxID=312017 RepID=Q22LJ6_TETTS|nr:zinc carboxypeptidase family protein [Tetrahymena thermophila SB210]EAR86144.3 zinc carboxypeptidase family protein [Tetrahymena thermophila SB210]|eukprot:XP_976739.3 zinc carboxypeptidase family protein [Tetrahymena thermophila SB210]
MDKTSFQTLKCHKHQKKHLQFVQVNDVLNQESQNKELFYCSSCFNHDLDFKSINYLMIDQILQEAESGIIPKWPPVNNYQIIQDLIDLTSKESELNYEKQIIDFFNEFKQQLLAKLDIIQKKMINETHKYPIDNHQIIKRYQEISNILQFKQLLMNEQENNLQEHSTLYQEFIQKFEKWTLDMQPFLTQINFQNCIQDKNKFDLLKNLGNNRINDIIMTAQKGLLNLNLDLFGTEYQNGQQVIVVRKNANNEYIITKINSNTFTDCISNFDLNKNLKYVFRIQIEKINQGNIFYVGLMRNSISKNQGGWEDYLTCSLESQNEYLKKKYNSGINILLKGESEFKAKKDGLIEIRVCLKDKLLEVTDFPNYQYKLGLEDQYKSKLEQYEDLRFYLGFQCSDIQICFKDVEIVDEFKY